MPEAGNSEKGIQPGSRGGRGGLNKFPTKSAIGRAMCRGCTGAQAEHEKHAKVVQSGCATKYARGVTEAVSPSWLPNVATC